MARNLIQDEIDDKRRLDKLRKVQDIKQWRIEHSKNREDFFKN